MCLSSYLIIVIGHNFYEFFNEKHKNVEYSKIKAKFKKSVQNFGIINKIYYLIKNINNKQKDNVDKYDFFKEIEPNLKIKFNSFKIKYEKEINKPSYCLNYTCDSIFYKKMYENNSEYKQKLLDELKLYLLVVNDKSEFSMKFNEIVYKKVINNYFIESEDVIKMNKFIELWFLNIFIIIIFNKIFSFQNCCYYFYFHLHH